MPAAVGGAWHRPVRDLLGSIAGRRKVEETHKVLVSQRRPHLPVHHLQEAALIERVGGIEGIALGTGVIIVQVFEVPRVHGDPSHLE